MLPSFSRYCQRSKTCSNSSTDGSLGYLVETKAAAMLIPQDPKEVEGSKWCVQLRLR